jgi:hypothetical protein
LLGFEGGIYLSSFSFSSHFSFIFRTFSRFSSSASPLPVDSTSSGRY